jgi:hypothetical protein
VGPVRLRLPDGVPSEFQQRELTVVPQVEPSLVPTAVRASQGRWDVAVAPALLHSEVGAADRRRPGAILQARKHEVVLEEVPMGTYH